jgi:2-polyprenyl-3-methyl-5-hydroxy-6-metoxy-1,4-benzoquinol methylase
MTGAASKYHRGWIEWGNGAGTHALLLDWVGFNKAVLEIGCNTGYLSNVMQQRGCRVTGVEIDADAAELARPFCQRLIVGDIERLDWKAVLGDEQFDVILFGDVLEHTRAPVDVLRSLAGYLTPAGYIVASLPNIAHGSIRLSLLLGRFEYAPLGILDETHLRFYTKETARQMLSTGGFRVTEMSAVRARVSPDLIDEVRRRYPQIGAKWISDVLSQEEATAFQYVFRAEPATRMARVQEARQVGAQLPLSIVVSHRGDPARLAACLDGLRAAESAFRRVIVISDSTPALERNALVTAWQPPDSDSTVAQALNRAIGSIDEDVALILDSAMVPQPGAIAALARRFGSDPSIGVAGGMVLTGDGSTIVQAGAYLSPPIGAITYRGAGYAADDARWDAVAEADFVPADLLAVRRSVWQGLNGFDEDYRANYLAADFCARAWAAGHRVLIEPATRAIAAFPTDLTLSRQIDQHRDRLRFVRKHYGRGRWPEGFFEAEATFRNRPESEPERQAMQLAYVWQAVDEGESDPLVAGPLLDFCLRTQDGGVMTERAKAPQLQLHQFSSSIPLIGGVIARLRAAWGNVAARWYAESIVRQQNMLNQALTDQVSRLAAELAEVEKVVLGLTAKLTDLERESEH